MNLDTQLKLLQVLVNLNLVRFTSYLNKDANFSDRHWLTTIFEQVGKLQIMVVVSCPVDFSGGKREIRSQYQLPVIKIIRYRRTRVFAVQQKSSSVPARRAAASRQQPLN